MATYDKRHLLKSAYNYTQAGQWDRAMEEYRKMTRLFPDDANVHSMIADLLAKKSDGPGAANEYLEAARLHKAAGADDKELQAIRKALRVKAGDEDATKALAVFMARGLAKAQEKLGKGSLDDAEALCQGLLDADPGSLPVNRLLDEVKAARLQAGARQAMAVEAAAAAPEPMPGGGDATSQVLDRLTNAVDAYLGAEDIDSAIETMMVMLKLDPGRVEVRQRLEATQASLEVKAQAQQAWHDLQMKQARQHEAVKQAGQDAKEQEAWKEQEQAFSAQLAQEQLAAEEAAGQELLIVEKAVNELRKRQSAGVALGAPGVPVSPSFSQEDEARLKALLQEKQVLEQRLLQERELAEGRQKELKEQISREAEMLNHAIEMAKQEAEAQAKATAVHELEARLTHERQEHQRRLEEERERSKKQEAALQQQMKELMREEMAKLREEVHGKAVAEVRQQMEEERQRREALEQEATQRAKEAERRAEDEKRRMEGARQLAEDNVRKEREAIGQLKEQEEARKQSIVEEAMKRRATRQGGELGERSQVMKASRRISDALHAAATKHLGTDVDALIEQARRYLKQDLLLDAMRICQKVTEADPGNEKVKELLKEIYVKKGL